MRKTGSKRFKLKAFVLISVAIFITGALMACSEDSGRLGLDGTYVNRAGINVNDVKEVRVMDDVTKIKVTLHDGTKHEATITDRKEHEMHGGSVTGHVIIKDEEYYIAVRMCEGLYRERGASEPLVVPPEVELKNRYEEYDISGIYSKK